MTEQPQDIKILQSEAVVALQQVQDAIALEEWRVMWLGRKGKIPLLLRSLKDLNIEQRKEVGPLANTVRQELEEAYKEKWTSFQKANTSTSVKDSEKKTGNLHPLTQTMRRIQNIFLEMGFTVVETPLVEDVRYNFDDLNIPLEHPARGEMDTFYLNNGHILRTHVSPAQIRGPLEQGIKPPYKMFYFGRCFRSERTDPTHETTFHQFEFMVVHEKASLAELKGIIKHFYSSFFGQDISVRLRPGYFPFVEPGLEVDLSCVFCQGKGCRVCKYSGWIEMAGAGMVHPNVLKNIGIDTKKYQGFALGGAVDRLTMLEKNVSDIRTFWSGDVTFLSKFA